MTTTEPTAPDKGTAHRAPSYEIWVAGRGDPTVFADDGLEVIRVGSGAVLRGRIADRAALHGLLGRLRAAGLDLVELHRLAEEA